MEKEVKEWIGRKWAIWDAEEPEWLDENMRVLILEEFIPNIKKKPSLQYSLRKYQSSHQLNKDSTRRSRINTEPTSATSSSERKN